LLRAAAAPVDIGEGGQGSVRVASIDTGSGPAVEVVVKTPTHWEQWYYSQLRPFTHYVPMKSFADLPATFFWCSTHPEECAAIAAEATAFAEKITRRYAVVDYKIQ
jgi:hypothetical protein